MQIEGVGRARRVAISGASGLIGSALSVQLRSRGVEVVHLVRRAARADLPPGLVETRWDTESGPEEPSDLEGLDAVVHLAGESVASGRWTGSRRRRIHDSRVVGTTALVRSLCGLARPPRALLAASATGYYGDRGATPLDERAAPGTGFLASVCVAWEQAARRARDAGIRVVCFRLGVVLARGAGALPRMLPAFRIGVGGPLGNGRQYLPWIALDDVVLALGHLLERDDLEGAVNLVAPEAVTSARFAETLGRVLGRPARLRVPAAVLRLALGAAADEMLLASARVVPERLQGSGFVFSYPTLDAALRQILGGAAKTDR